MKRVKIALKKVMATVSMTMGLVYGLVSGPVFAKGQQVDIQINGTEVYPFEKGTWSAVIKGDKVEIQLKWDEDSKSYQNMVFSVHEFTGLGARGSESFVLVRDPGKIDFAGKFEGNQGHGTYKYTCNEKFLEFLKAQGINNASNKSSMAYFGTGINRDYVTMLKTEKLPVSDENKLIALSAVKVDKDYIESIRQSGFASVSVDDLVAMKALHISQEYIRQTRKVHKTNLTVQQLIESKATEH